MKVLNTITIILILLTQAKAQGNYHKGKIFLTDGTVLSGYTEIPSRLFDNAIKYKQTKKSDPRSIFSSSIDSLEYETSKITSKFIYVFCDKYKRKTGEIKSKKRKRWLNQNWKTKYMNVYSAADKYEIDKNGIVNIVGNMSIEYYVKRRGEANCFLVYSYVGDSKTSKYFNESLIYYCKDAPRLIRKIKKGEFTWERLYEVAETYNWCRSNKKKE